MKRNRGRFSKHKEQLKHKPAEFPDAPRWSKPAAIVQEADVEQAPAACEGSADAELAALAAAEDVIKSRDLAQQENCNAVIGAEAAAVDIGQNEASEHSLQEQVLQEQVLHETQETETRKETIKKTREKPELEREQARVRERFAEKPSGHGLVYEILDWGKYILLALVMGLIITGYIVQRNEVVGVSMDPTLKNADRVWVQKLSKLWNGIERGDVVTVNGAALSDGSLKQEDLVKRVIAVAGDQISISEGQVYLNGQRLDEPYLAANVETYMPNSKSLDITIAAGQYFVMGDNRGSSKDSRYFGPITADAILGEVWFRTSPLDRLGLIH